MLPTIFGGGGLAISLTLLIRLFVTSKNSTVEHDREALNKMSERVSLLELKMGMFWKQIEENLPRLLRQPTHKEMDRLLDKLEMDADSLTLEECYRLRTLIQATYRAPDKAKPDMSTLLLVNMILGVLSVRIVTLEQPQL